MIKLERILVPIDFSTGSRAAARQAAALAQTFGALIDLIYVWNPSAFLAPGFVVVPQGEVLGHTIEEIERAEIAVGLQQLAAELKTDFGVEVRERLVAGDPANEIVEAAAGGNYDLIVMSTHGRTGLPRLLIGSVAEKVVRRARCAVLTVRESGSASAPPPEASTRP